MLSLRRLEHFTVLAEENSFSKAARRLHLTQPALTRSIQTLEDTLGLKLLDRTTEGATLTEAGRRMLARAERMLVDARALQREAQAIRGFDTGQVIFGVGVFPAAAFLSEVLVRQAREHPGLSVEVEIESWQRLLEKLKRDELDFVVALSHTLPPPADYVVRRLHAQRFGFFVRAGHPLLALEGDLFRAALSGYGLATTKLPPKARRYVAGLYGLEDSEDLPAALICDSIRVLRDVAHSTDTVLFATHEALRPELEQGSLRPLPLLAYADASPLPIEVIHSGGRSLSPAAEWLIGAIGEQLLAQEAGLPVDPRTGPLNRPPSTVSPES
jgi:DNA-binding transcriptional LysR family regulator